MCWIVVGRQGNMPIHTLNGGQNHPKVYYEKNKYIKDLGECRILFKLNCELTRQAMSLIFLAA
jgi:hypothetical protein